MDKKRLKNKYLIEEDEACWISFQIDGVANEILNQSAKKNRRAKRQEAAIRLTDHLKRFSNLVQEETK